MEANRNCVIATVIFVILLLLVEGLIIGFLVRKAYENEELVDYEEIGISSDDIEEESDVIIDLSKPWNHFRLPNDLVPIEYKVNLRPLMEPNQEEIYMAYGSSSVIFECRKATKYIVMHNFGISITSNDKTSLEQEGNEIKITDIQFYENNQFIVLKTAEPCVEGKYYTLHFKEFSFVYSDDQVGMYISHYQTSDGKLRSMIMSQMEPVGARQTFPCFDEPHFKANFTITLWYKPSPGRIALSNMPAKSNKAMDIDGDVWNSTTFEESMPMSTYLLVFVITDHSHIESHSKSGVLVRTYAKNDSISMGYADHASEIVPNFLDFFAETFDYPYVLTKADQVAFPQLDFVAMENWGLVSYVSDVLMYNSKVASVFDKALSITVIGHEISHQWFGNLVTPEWWSEVWLNEGFATFLSYFVQESVLPTSGAKTRFFLDNFYKAMQADIEKSTHALIYECNSFADIFSMMGIISYNKGACVLQMIRSMMGEENFIKSLKMYIKDLAYGTSSTKQLIGYLEPKSEKEKSFYPTSLDIILSTWTTQIGYPIITIVRNQKRSTYTFTQKSFAIRDEEQSENDGVKWYVPIIYKVLGDGKTQIKKTWVLPDVPLVLSENELILVNVDAVGYYQTNYDNETWMAIAEYLNSDNYMEIPEISRAQLIGDAFKMMETQRMDVITLLELTKYLVREKQYAPWKIFEKGRKHLDNMLRKSPIYKDFSRYVLSLINPLYESYDWLLEPEIEDTEIMKKMAIQISVRLACYYGNADCIAKSVKLYDEWMKNPSNISVISVTYREDVMCTAIRHGGAKEWNYAWITHQRTKNEKEKEKLRYAMACGRESWMLLKLLDYCIEVMGATWGNCLQPIVENGQGSYISWLYILERTARDITDFALIEFAKMFSTKYEWDLLHTFNVTNNMEDPSSILEAIAIVEDNMSWREENENRIADWLIQNA